jgi:hypothetical protein
VLEHHVRVLALPLGYGGQTLHALLVGGVDGPSISDGVDHATQPAGRTFPYLCRPNPEPPDLASVLAAASEPPEESALSPA